MGLWTKKVAEDFRFSLANSANYLSTMKRTKAGMFTGDHATQIDGEKP